ncbi:MAG: hypothetical protein M0D55_16010 [Elusimicrobiota bacterium]|nr:MAG: hypothetical protein M0D55_16010 [Elusimicrobiota bacterium]
MHKNCFLSWPKREEFRARQNLDYKRRVNSDQTIFQMQEDGTVLRVPVSPPVDTEIWLAQMYYASILAHLSLVATAKAIEGKDEIILEDLEPQVSAHDFLEILLFVSYCNGMFSRIGLTRGRNFVLDSMYLLIGDFVSQIHGVEAAVQYEKIRSARITRYMNQVNNLRHGASPKLGVLLASLLSSFEREVLKRPMPALAPAILGLLTADEAAVKRNPGSLDAMKVDLGRNNDLKSISKLREQFELAERNPPHFNKMHALMTHYLD